MKIIIGLGNPDKKYAHTRHNLGALIIQNVVQDLKLSLNRQPKLLATIADYQDYKIAILDTYMNESGLAVQKIISYYKIDPQDLYIIHDDLDLKVGEWKLQFDRSAAGHNGIKSIIEQLGTQAFHRLRVGIDHPRNSTNPNLAVENYVLLPFLPAEKVLISQTVDTITQEISHLLGP